MHLWTCRVRFYKRVPILAYRVIRNPFLILQGIEKNQACLRSVIVVGGVNNNDGIPVYLRLYKRVET